MGNGRFVKCQTRSLDWRVYELKRCRAFESFSFDTFLSRDCRMTDPRSDNDFSRLTVIFQSVIHRCVLTSCHEAWIRTKPNWLGKQRLGLFNIHAYLTATTSLESSAVSRLQFVLAEIVRWIHSLSKMNFTVGSLSKLLVIYYLFRTYQAVHVRNY